MIDINSPEPYRSRCLDILRRHPEVRQLFGRTPSTASLIVAAIALQLTIAFLLRGAPWWLIIVAGGFGAFIDHALVGLYHECAHNLVFRRAASNHLLGILANLPLVIPCYASFCGYHLSHHQYEDNDQSQDADRTARPISRPELGNAVRQLLFPSKHHQIPFFNRWVFFNAAVQLSFLALLHEVWGPRALLYLVTSFLFSVVIHPLGARWILEHLVAIDNKETYSYYGPMNWLSVNMGYHNEHHDFPFVPWNRLPSLKALAPEVYGRLPNYESWMRIWGLAAADWYKLGTLLSETLLGTPSVTGDSPKRSRRCSSEG